MIKSMIAYFQFFTRLVIPIELDEPLVQLKKGSKFLPIFGLLIGIIEGFIYWGAATIFTPIIAFVCVLFFDVLFTGAMHQDGLADMADGLYSSRTKERMLEIMKDSRLGTMGALALLFYYLFMFSIFSSYTTYFVGVKGVLLILGMNIAAKNNLTLLFFKMTYAGASKSGLGKTWEGVSVWEIILAQVISLGLLLVIFQIAGLVAYIAGVSVTLIYRMFVYKKVEGVSGDTLGAIAPISSVVFLLTICAVGGIG
ncbi:cobalamin 5'-phosphate synthase [Enterococcus sp. AZ194]|uniref:adenosylcobinamide-GDP ribazoletransferase n=1 Tax=Enterococcus sp. AZ194 TaxID=2774629 RepID=UPI003F23B2D0